MKRWICCLWMLMLLSTCAYAQEMAESACQVFLNGRELTVYETAVSHQRFWTENPELNSTPVAIATQEGECRVEILFPAAQVQSAVVRPLALNIETQIRDGKVCFTLPEPSNVTVEYNGQVQGALHLFLDQPDTQKPDGQTPKTQYFGPGVHRDVLITPKSGQTVYLDEGAIVYGQIFSGIGTDFTIAGHGVLCGSIYDRYEDTIVPISFTNCSGFTIRDITILDPSAWTLNLLRCKDVTIDNVKIVGARSNSDGITMQNCKNVRVQNCFVRSWDDSLVVKGYNGDVENITFENCILWTDLAQSCEIGYETRAKFMRNITFRNITVLHNFHKPVLSVHNSDNAAVSQVLFENITVEDAQMGEGDGTPWLLELTTTESQWSASYSRGSIRDVNVRNVQVLSGKKPGIRIFSHDAAHNIDDVSITGLIILGEEITGFDQLVYEESPDNGANIRFE